MSVFSVTCFCALRLLVRIQEEHLDWNKSCSNSSQYFTQQPMRRMHICFTDVFFCFLFFSRPPQNTRQPFSGTAELIFMKLLPNDSGENVVCIAVPKWGLGPRLIFWDLKTTHCALGGDTWRVTEN